MADINVTITEPEVINIKIEDAVPINVVINEWMPSWINDIFMPPDGKNRVVKLYVEDGKFRVDYEVI